MGKDTLQRSGDAGVRAPGAGDDQAAHWIELGTGPLEEDGLLFPGLEGCAGVEASQKLNR